MSYCVNCGVELEKGCAMCPLCDTPVLNPREGHKPPDIPAYPEIVKIPKATQKRFTVFVISMVMLLPNIMLAVLDMLFWEGEVSSFIIGASMVAWLWFLFPFLWKKPIPVVILGIDALALIAFLKFCSLKTTTSPGWFSSLVLPVVITLWAICNIFIFWLKKPRSKTAGTIAAIIAVNIMTFVVEICLNMFYNGKLQVEFSLVVAACSVPLIIFFIALVKSRRLKAWVSRKFFV
ncbi:MAG: hypothetical protein IJB45_03820 [Clostridia bacterium]|nr:hypothetical protein [Clostridia bacterium]